MVGYVILFFLILASYFLYGIGALLNEIYGQLRMSHESYIKMTKNQDAISKIILRVGQDLQRSSKKSKDV